MTGDADELLIRATGLTVAYPARDGPVRAVDGLDLTVSEGEIVGLVGVSGSGKSSAALALMDLVPSPGRITAGEVRFRGTDLRTLSTDEQRRIRGNNISLIVQSPRAALNPMLTVGKQISNVVRAHSPASRATAMQRAVEMLRLVGINDPERRVDAYPHELSGGMAQRALIAMSLVCEPALLIADEPTSGLDVTIQAQILDDLYASVRTVGTAALLVTQDFGVVANYCDRVVVLYGGQVAESVGVENFFREAGHPSAEALLSSQRTSGHIRLRGPSFDHHNRPPGCLLAPRCPWAQDDPCTTAVPDLREVAPGHLVRCARYEDIQDEMVALMAGLGEES